MKRYFIVLLTFVTVSAIAQNKNAKQTNAFHRFSPSSQLEMQRLDSIYMSAMHVDKSKCAFPDKEDTVSACWSAFLQDVGKTLKEKNFKWQNETRVFMRCYFNEIGNIDYCMYNIRDTSFTQYKEFEDALKDFASGYNFGLKCDKKYVQCGAVILGRKK